MPVRFRDALVTLAVGILVAGAASAVVLPLLPGAWRIPAVPWGILLGSTLAVALWRHPGGRR
ncbi:MAG TPA: hypothetical protein PLN93_07075 [Vicinamibacterales bacterium]|mgnify:CR=1 FL=1|nr:hypothetical protein [Vicinamibacterales bacterium]HPK71687.1 hypothetical protein [Vicinamibacterales bacterium]HPW21421.1 hypothetical protein [Vicinamibacterales bacterium]